MWLESKAPYGTKNERWPNSCVAAYPSILFYRLYWFSPQPFVGTILILGLAESCSRGDRSNGLRCQFEFRLQPRSRSTTMFFSSFRINGRNLDMRFLNTIIVLSTILFASLWFTDHTNAQFASQFSSRGYYPFVIALPQDRQWIRDTPIQRRPTRPLHFYGNIIRQSYSVGPTNRVLRTSRPTGIPLIDSRRR